MVNYADNRGTITQSNGLMRVNNGFVEEVVTTNPQARTGYLVFSYIVLAANGMATVQRLRLNINNNTTLVNSLGRSMCLCDIRRGMWIDALFSPVMSRSMPPQSTAFLIAVKQELRPTTAFTTGRITMVDPVNRFLYTEDLRNRNQQTRFLITNQTSILDRNGNTIPLRSLRPGQTVQVTHALTQTASIPPQTTAFLVQLL